MKALTSIALCGALFLVGCGARPHTPTNMTGPVRLTVANNTNETQCAFAMVPVNGADQAENWLGKGSKAKKLAPGETIDFNVREGDYKLAAGGCDFPTFMGVTVISIHGPTYLSVGNPPPAPPPTGNVVTLAVKLVHDASEVPHVGGGGGGGGGGAGQTQAADSNADSNCMPAGMSGAAVPEMNCCSKHGHKVDGPISHYENGKLVAEQVWQCD